MKKHVIAIVSMLVLTACQMPKDDSRFISAKLSADGTRGVFVFKRERYFWVAKGLWLGQPRFWLNYSVIGSYDLASGKKRVLYRRDNGSRYVHNSDDFHIGDIQGSTALISAGHGMLYLLNLDSAKLTLLPVKQEMARRGRDFGYVYLVDGKGTLVIVNQALSDRDKPSAMTTKQIWLRRPSGALERISDVPPRSEGYYGFKENEVHFYSAERGAYLIYNLDRRDFHPGHPRAIPRGNDDVTAAFRVDEHGSPQLKIARKIGGTWVEQEVQMNANDL